MKHWSLKRREIFASLLIACVVSASAAAAPATIVALGASNSRGPVVSPAQTYPAQLEAALRAHGRSVQVVNMGVIGASSADLLARVGRIPAGAKPVIYEYSALNDRKKSVANSSANMAAIQRQLAARGIRSIDITNYIASEFQRAVPAGMTVMFGVPHLNGRAYAELVQAILPQVEPALGQ